MIMFVSLVVLIIIIIMFSMLFIGGSGLILMSIKVFNVGFFGEFELLLSVWGVLFLLMVLLISSSVICFSFSYMSSLAVSNFMLMYLGFVGSMVWLIINNNFYWMMLGWDGLGVVSFLLIVFYMNHESVNNGLFTLFQNRIGDLFFVVFILGVIDMFMLNNMVLKWGVVVLLIGASVKSAQFPFNSWLLSAMSAPTPISSLVHSSTLVVAGVYILLQFSYCLMDVMEIMKYISLLTLLFSSFGLLNEFDMKKLIAYSTMSHVALMMYLFSFKLYKVVYFHLNVHAMFKSMMFMCFGFVMLVSYHAQDKRLVSLLSVNPLIKMSYYYSCLCLAGLPFLSGFFSKDLIIEKVMDVSSDMIMVIFLLMFLSISIYYSMKLLNLISVLHCYSMVEKSKLSMYSVMVMMIIMVSVINVYISMIFSVTLEVVSFKMSIYFLILIFLLLSLMTNLNWKIFSYSKMSNFKEIWCMDYYMLDKFVYWNVFLMLEYISGLSQIKLMLLMNWWMMIMVIVVF